VKALENSWDDGSVCVVAAFLHKLVEEVVTPSANALIWVVYAPCDVRSFPVVCCITHRESSIASSMGWMNSFLALQNST
jgi:hypothetical protein